MPLYDYQCSNEACNTIFETVKPYEARVIECPYCQMVANRIVSKMRRSQIDIFQPDYYENLGDDMPYITSKAQLAEECEKREMSSVALMNETRLHGRGRWI